ncbi:MAG: aldolase/citrate lyase family protein, partial [candidate division NC10 bacterium]
MRPNPVKRLLRDSRPAIGTWLNIGSPITAEAVATLGFDWLVVDTEHSPIGIETATAMFQAIGGMGGVPMVRIPATTAEHFKRVLDAAQEVALKGWIGGDSKQLIAKVDALRAIDLGSPAAHRTTYEEFLRREKASAFWPDFFGAFENPSKYLLIQNLIDATGMIR